MANRTWRGLVVFAVLLMQACASPGAVSSGQSESRESAANRSSDDAKAKAKKMIESNKEAQERMKSADEQKEPPQS